jgi:hypothetical protein
MTKNRVSVHSYFSLDSHETTQKRPQSTKIGNSSAKSAHFKAGTCDERELHQPELTTLDCSQDHTQKPRSKPKYLGPVRLTKTVVGSIVWWARCDGGNSPEGFMQVFEGNGYPQLRHPNSKEALENPHLLNTKTPDRIAAVFVNEAGQSDPVWIDLKREALIQCD